MLDFLTEILEKETKSTQNGHKLTLPKFQIGKLQAKTEKHTNLASKLPNPGSTACDFLLEGGGCVDALTTNNISKIPEIVEFFIFGGPL